MDAVLAIDIGGTSVKAEVQDRDGTALSRGRRATTAPGGEGSVLDAVTAAAGDALDARPARTEVVAAGVVVPGIVDADRGVCVRSVNLGWQDVPVARILTERLGLPVRVGHDVFSAGRAEIERGAARGVDSSGVVVVGTGVSAVLTAGGRVVRGGLGQAGELGHLVVQPRGPACACGRRGCVEALASAAAIGRRYAERSRSAVGVSTAEVPTEVVDAAGVLAKASSGDRVASRVWQEATTALGDALLAVTTLLAPSVIVVGGGLGEAGEALLEPLRRHLEAHVTVEQVPDLVGARFGARSGVVGAGLLAQGIGELG